MMDGENCMGVSMKGAKMQDVGKVTSAGCVVPYGM